jgi:hypothetical protein
MRLQILDVNKFITSQNLKEVVNTKMVSSKNFEPGSLWDPLIFGNVGSNMRKTRYAYVNLGTNAIHPQLYPMIKSLSPEMSKLLSNKSSFVFTNKKLIEDIDNGRTGIGYLIENIDNIDFTKCCKKEKIEDAKYLESIRKQMLIDKWIIMPAAYRDIDTSKGSFQQVSEINDFYKYLIYLRQQISGDYELDSVVIDKIEQTLLKVVTWCQSMLKSKKGLMRGNMLKKTIDYSCRLVLDSSPNIDLGYIGLPWHALMSIFEPIFTYNLFNKFPKVIENIKIHLNIIGDLDSHQLHRFVLDTTKNPDSITVELKSQLREVVNETIKDQQVIVKRDPVVNRSNWFAAHPMITDGRVAIVNSMDLSPIGGDSILGNVVVYEKQNDSYVSKIIDISKFNESYNCTFLKEELKSNNRTYKYYEVNDEVYSPGIDMNTGEIIFNKINLWHIHENIKLHNIFIDLFKFIAGSIKSYFVFNIINNKFLKIDIDELKENKDIYSFIQVEENKINFIPCKNIRIEEIEETTGYDFTMDNGQSSFLHESGLIQANSDGQ